MKKEIGQKIREARIERGLTQRELGILAGGLTKSTVCLWEKGQILPGGEIMWKLIKLLKLKV